MSMLLSLLCGCSMRQGEDALAGIREAVENLGSDSQDGAAGDAVSGEKETDAADSADDSQTQQTVAASPADRLYEGLRPALLEQETDGSSSVVPCVEAYIVEPDLSNVENLWQIYLQDSMADKLVQNGFVVAGSAGREFYEVYETNRYSQIPNFVTVDSLMHTYHLYFSYLLKNTEKNYLSGALLSLSRRMLEDSQEQYEQLAGSEWESAAKRNVAFFTVGAKLLDDSIEADGRVEQMVSAELDKIRSAEGIYLSEITGDEEDYTQYIPRGYYEGDPELEAYFKAMMWYGRIHFAQKEEDLDRSALLITKALADDGEACELWEAVYAVTSFFAGASDDRGVCEYGPVLAEVYGRNITAGDLIGDEAAFEKFHELTAKLPAPKINSIPIFDGEDNTILGFRFMGQRFTVDAAVMQRLIYSDVKENSQGEKRMLPDVLDVPAALGSDIALQILKQGGALDYAGYAENMELLRAGLAGENSKLWSASLYSGWLNTLRPLLLEKGEGYPVFMQNEEWMKKDLECFAGSFTELKHDTILYSKQAIAEMGGGYDEEPDDRGYVQPEPVVYERFADLSRQTQQGLLQFGMLSAADQENLERLTYMAEQLLTISNKELVEESLTEEEYEFIRTYGGSIEHFWYEVIKDTAGDEEQINRQEYPAAIVVDIATDPNGTVLEAATGDPSCIYVLVKVEGKLKIAKGSVYTFYQFPWPMEDRLTDSKWRQMMGLQTDESGYYNYDNRLPQPEWTESYRHQYEWE
ncbi:MAG: DUF3160 domain-containing protein [Eubacteriales bacterium]|nr:DUF3160 domain-containing protein [Eubacteriales bacterium]